MAVVYGLALILVVIVYLFVLGASTPWPGGPQLAPEAVRNLSLSLLVVILLLCGLLLGGMAQSIGSIAARATLKTDEASTLMAVVTVTPSDSAQAAIASVTATPAPPQPDATASDRSTTAAPPDTALTSTPIDLTPTETLVATETPVALDQTLTETPGITLTPAPLDVTLTPTPTPTASPASLPFDPRELVETVLRAAIERANDAQAEAILGGDEGAVDPWWSGPARDRAIENVRRLRSRFITFTEVQWSPLGEGIRLLTSSPLTATYTTSETWTFTGTIDRTCPDGSPMLRRYVESYPSEQYTLELRDGIYTVTQWQLGQAITNEVRTFCP